MFKLEPEPSELRSAAIVAESTIWRARSGRGGGCASCPLRILSLDYINPFTETGSNCAAMYMRPEPAKVADAWDKLQGEIVIAFTIFDAGLGDAES